MFIRSERLFLRPYWPEDRAELLALGEAGRTARLPAAWPMAHEPEDRRCPRFLVTLPAAQGSPIVGFVGLGRVAELVEAGLWIAPRYRARGFGAEALQALLSLARTLGLSRVIARPGPSNEPGRRLLEKLCFEPEGDMLVRELGDAYGCTGDGGQRLAA